ncbi:MAG: SapC family protein [Loktanella sp.]|nr:SapC family protein [Loktanella sp.]
MFRKAEALHPAKHKSLRIAAIDGYGFASKTLTVPIVFSEMADIAREYPLLFQKNTDTPVALMGAKAGVNAYVAADGRWLATYKPARIATYPFALVPIPDKPAEMALVVDMAADQIGPSIGDALFDTNGQPSPALKARLDVLKKMKEQEATTARMVRQIRAAGLLVERAIRVSQKDDKDRQITGLEFINEKALNTMAHEDFAKLRDGGVLPLIYAHLLSMSNLRQGPIAGTLGHAGNKMPEMTDQIDVDGILQRHKSSLPEQDLAPTQDGNVVNIAADTGDFDLSAFVKPEKSD